MKCRMFIFYLVVVADFSIFGSCVSDEDTADEPNFEMEDRWQRELVDFKAGLKMMTDKGELAELKIGDETSARLQSSGREDIKFYLYTKLNSVTPQRLEKNDISLQRSNYDASKPTFFITHGWVDHKDGFACTRIRDAYLRHKDGNVIVVDWSLYARASYPYSAFKVALIGRRIARMIKYLQRAGFLSFDQTTLVGHSLGAHVMGIAGFRTQGRIQHIIGLDPAMPFFTHASPGQRISDEDARYVEIVHTNAGLLGSNAILGHTDFFVNGGAEQPGCAVDVFGVCSHARAFEIFAESINPRKSFLALECKSGIKFSINLCTGPRIARLGVIRYNPRDHGVFYLPTNERSPFAIKNVSHAYVAKHVHVG